MCLIRAIVKWQDLVKRFSNSVEFYTFYKDTVLLNLIIWFSGSISGRNKSRWTVNSSFAEPDTLPSRISDVIHKTRCVIWVIQRK